MINSLLAIWNTNKQFAYEESGLSPLRQLVQIARWYVRGFNANEYYIYPLYLVDPRPVITTKEYDRLQNTLNPPRTGVVEVDKWIQSAIWKANNIPHSEALGFVKCCRGILLEELYDGDICSFREFLVKLTLPIVTKPLDGSNGEGFDILNAYCRETGGLSFVSGGEVSVESYHKKFLASTKGILFQKKIIQHSVLGSISPSSVNTVRMVTHRRGDGEVVVLQAIVKFGGGGSLIDNNLHEGILAEVSLSNGVVGVGRKRLGGGEFSKHPDTGIQIEGVSLPFWEETLELAVRAHNLLPSPSHLGWDIAISKQGPLVVEMNSYLSVAVNQKVHGKKSSGLDS